MKVCGVSQFRMFTFLCMILRVLQIWQRAFIDVLQSSADGVPAWAHRLILNIDHVYSRQRDSLVITISTDYWSPSDRLASYVAGARPAPALLGPARLARHRRHSAAIVGVASSLTIVAVDSVCLPVEDATVRDKPRQPFSLFVCNFIK